MDDEEIEEPRIIKVITKLPNEEPRIVEMSTKCEVMKAFCKGMLGASNLPTDETIQIIYNDNFLNFNMEPNIVLPEWEEAICGPLIVTGYVPDTGDTVSLTEKQIEKTLKYLKRNNLHHMSIEGAYRYSKVIYPLQKSFDAMGIDETEMEAES